MISESKPDDFPSLSIKPQPYPGGWIQWKGTEVCCDIHCLCGASYHFDGDFMYHVKCEACGRVYECDGHFALRELQHEPEYTKVLCEDGHVEYPGMYVTLCYDKQKEQFVSRDDQQRLVYSNSPEGPWVPA